MKKTISKNFEATLDPCKYKVDISFSCFDVLTGEELNGLNVLIDDKVIEDYTITETEVNGVIRYIYRCQTLGPKTFTLTIEKTRYYPFSKMFTLGVTSIYDDTVVESLRPFTIIK